MCGIAGIYDRQGAYSKDQLENIVKAMCDRLKHRGPDNSGIWISNDGKCALGHRRLSIIDLSNQSHQPLVSQSSALSFNGEIYNYVELAQKLKKRGLNFNHHSDTHTLLAGLDNNTENFITELDGMFGFAHYNQTSGQLLLARDPFGEKTVYYTELNGCVFFASEMGAFNAIPDFVGEVTQDQLSLYLYFQYPPAPHTIFANVFKLSPGTYKRFAPHSNYAETQYFIPDFNGTDCDDSKEKLHTKLDDVLSESLQRRLRSDVSLGAFLSGGIDSSTVVSLITQKFDRKIDTYSVGFNHCDKSEHKLAEQISSTLGTKHNSLMFDATHYADYVDEIASFCEPNADTSCIPTYLVAKLASQDHKVCLTGDGGDELFGGYNRYYQSLNAAKGKETHMQQRQWHLGNEYINTLNITPHKELRVLFEQPTALMNDVLLQYRRNIDTSTKHCLSRFRQVDLSLYLPSVLAKVDRMSMAHSLETRTPFLSTDVFQFAANINIRHLYDGHTSKNILRSLLKQYIPEPLIQKKKVGFSFIGENKANALALDVLMARFYDEIKLSNCFLINMFGNQKLKQLMKDLAIVNQAKQLQVVWALLLLNSFMKNCRYRIV